MGFLTILNNGTNVYDVFVTGGIDILTKDLVLLLKALLPAAAGLFAMKIGVRMIPGLVKTFWYQ